MISGSLDSKVIIWNIDDRQIIKTLQENNSTVYGIIELFNHKILSYYNNSKICVKEWDLEERTKEMSINTYFVGHKGFTSGVQISDDFVLLGVENGNLDLYKCSPSGVVILSYSNIHNSSITQILTINQTFVITCSTDKTIKIFDVNRKSVVCEYEKLHTDSVEDILIQESEVCKILMERERQEIEIERESMRKSEEMHRATLGREKNRKLVMEQEMFEQHKILHAAKTTPRALAKIPVQVYPLTNWESYLITLFEGYKMVYIYNIYIYIYHTFLVIQFLNIFSQ